MKEMLHVVKSAAYNLDMPSAKRLEGDVRIDDPAALRALAHPARLTVIDELYQGSERTSSELADLTGLTLNELAVFRPHRLALHEVLIRVTADFSVPDGSQIGDLGKVNLSANWMAAPAVPGDAADLYAAVQAVGLELCPALGITIPVGKDSMSMSTVWHDGPDQKRITAPVSLIVSAFASVADIRLSLTPQLQYDRILNTEIAETDSKPSVSSESSVLKNPASD